VETLLSQWQGYAGACGDCCEETGAEDATNALMNPPQDSQADGIKLGGTGTKLQASPTPRLANKAQARCMPGICWPHAVHIWPMVSMGHWYSPHSIVRWDN